MLQSLGTKNLFYWPTLRHLVLLLTNLSQIYLPTSIRRTSPFHILEVLAGIFFIFHFYSSFNRTFCKQIVKTLIRRRVLWRLVWICAVYLCPTKRKLGLYKWAKLKIYFKSCKLSLTFNSHLSSKYMNTLISGLINELKELKTSN